MCEATTTQTTTVPGQTEREKQMTSLVTDTLLPTYLEDAGYEISDTNWDTNPKYKKLQEIREKRQLAQELGYQKRTDMVAGPKGSGDRSKYPGAGSDAPKLTAAQAK